MNTLIPFVTLNNGVQMPQLGLGVWQTADGQQVESAVTAALDSGYRLIDTAAAYGNEAGVGHAIQASSVARKDIFVTTKLWNADQGYDTALRAFDKSLAKLGLDYIDLYLIHWPMPAAGKYIETWQALEKLYADKRVRAIGVSNFQPEHLQNLLTHSVVTPSVNQIELHPDFQQRETRNICTEHNIRIESWSPIGGSGGNLLNNPTIVSIAATYDKSPAQIVLRWHIQNDFIVIPKSVHAERIRENAAIFDFELNPEHMKTLNGMETGNRTGPDPATANFK